VLARSSGMTRTNPREELIPAFAFQPRIGCNRTKRRLTGRCAPACTEPPHNLAGNGIMGNALASTLAHGGRPFSRRSKARLVPHHSGSSSTGYPTTLRLGRRLSSSCPDS
jgi:hypothetical protein